MTSMTNANFDWRRQYGYAPLDGAMYCDGVVGGIERATGTGSDAVARRRLFAGVAVDDARAQFARDATTPAELAVALLDHFHARRVVATPTTHDVTSVRP